MSAHVIEMTYNKKAAAAAAAGFDRCCELIVLHDRSLLAFAAAGADQLQAARG